MKNLSAAEQLAEAPPNTHPVVVDRLAKDLDSTANLVENSLVGVFVDEAVFAAGQRLVDVLGSMLTSAERQRDLYGTPSVEGGQTP